MGVEVFISRKNYITYENVKKLSIELIELENIYMMNFNSSLPIILPHLVPRLKIMGCKVKML